MSELPDSKGVSYLLRAHFYSCRYIYTLCIFTSDAWFRVADVYDTALENTLRRLICVVLPIHAASCEVS